MGIFRCNSGFSIDRMLLLCFTCCAFLSCKPKAPPAKVNAETTTATKPKPVALNNCSYSNEVSSLGIGLVMATDTVDLFNDSLLTNRFMKVSMYGDNMNVVPICPKFYKPDYGIMHFVCLSQTSKVYRVLNGNADIKYLPKAKGYDFITWEKYILSSFGIRRNTSNGSKPVNGQPLRRSPGSADTVAIPKGLEMFCPVKLQGNWLQVKYDCFYNDEKPKHEAEPCNTYISECKNPVTGWIKWREANKLLIDIFVME